MIFTVCVEPELDKYRIRCLENAAKLWGHITIIGQRKFVKNCSLIDWRKLWKTVKLKYELETYTNLCICNWLRLYIMSEKSKCLYFDTDIWFNRTFNYTNGGYANKNWLCLFANGQRCKKIKDYLEYVKLQNPKNIFCTLGSWWKDGLLIFDDNDYYHGLFAYVKAGQKIKNMEKLTIYKRLNSITPEYKD